MSTIGAYQAKTEFSNLIKKVMRGERIIITRYGEPVAMISPIKDAPSRPIIEIIEDIEVFRKDHRLENLTVREMLEEGRA
ncbi:MAG: type II toxin-antitoxin system prevent-host-death family antitoxin [Anaerolineales bacterium]|nr:type II toxin-antitoxin system prevent-host-death family antitoxin [Anaerolineales bacterium]